MADSLRDQLLKSGIVKQVREDKRVKKHTNGRPNAGSKDGARKPASPDHAGNAASSAEMDLARAYALRARSDAGERKRAQAEAAAKAQARKERKRKLEQALAGNVLNKPDADVLRHFEYGEKIRRIYVDGPQLAALNAGDLGVVQHAGRYILVKRAVAVAVSEFAPEQIALLVDKAESRDDDDGVPDDLTW